MQDNRNTCNAQGNDARGVVCIDTTRVLDACRDRDCFEDERVYLTAGGEAALAAATNVRTKCAKILCAFVGVNDIPFNNGFFQVSIRYYVEVTFEACVGTGRSQTFKGIATLEKDVVLYGGEGNITSYSSTPGGSFCDPCCSGNATTNLPTAVVDTVEPIVLGTKVCERCCNCGCDALDLPEQVQGCLGEELVDSQSGLEIRVSFGIFSIIRIERPAQLLIQATDYSVPDKECTSNGCGDSPCDVFRGIAFPTARFKTTGTNLANETPTRQGGCGCGK